MMLISRHAPHRPRRYRRWVRCLSAIVVGIAIACSGFRGPGVVHGQTQAKGESARRGPDGPRIKVTPEEINFGNVRLGKRVRASFTIANAGNRPLKFTEAPYIEVNTGCCPPVVMLEAWALKPGEQTTLSMEFMMVGKKQGPYDFRVHLPTNDPIQPDRTVAVLSNWVP